MANNSNGGSAAMPIIGKLITILKNFLKIGTFIEDGFIRSFLVTIWGEPGIGKSAVIRALAEAGVAAYFMPGGMYGDLTDAVPTPRVIQPDIDTQIKIWEMMAKKVDAIPPHIQTAMFRSQIESASKREIEMINPRHRFLEEFLLKCEADRKAKKLKSTPVIFVDEATHMNGKARDRLVTDLCDGDLCRKLGLTWVPLVVFLANGRAFGGKENTPLTTRQIHRAVQFIYYPDVDDIPSKVENINSLSAKKERQRARDAALRRFREGENSLSDRELPRNDAGNPRAQEIFYWMCSRVKRLNIPEAIKFMSEVAAGYFREGDDLTNAIAYVRIFFGVLPASMDEVRELIKDNGKNIPASVKGAKLQMAGWVNWARAISSGTTADQETLATFAELCGVKAEIAQTIRTDKEELVNEV
jgi:hypothetical protein